MLDSIMMGVRTTVILDEDVLNRVKQRAREADVPFRVKLNELLRVGLAKSGAGRLILSSRKVYSRGDSPSPLPLRLSEASEVITGWLENPLMVVPALALAHGAGLVTFDRDFRKDPGAVAGGALGVPQVALGGEDGADFGV
jgi:hypothetical protein